MPTRPSIKDIAELAGVAPSTVSRALAGSERISEETRQRVQTIASDLDYTPSAAARSLVTGASKTLGVIAPSLSDPYVAAVMQGIECASAAGRQQLVIASTGGQAQQEVEAVRMLLGQMPIGLIVLSSRAGDAYDELLGHLDTPLLFVNSAHSGANVYSITTDNEYGGWLATQHLLELGHRRIAYLGGPAAGRSQQARIGGYRRALQEAGASFDRGRVFEGDGSSTSGRETLQRILAQPVEKRPTAVFCYNDLSALGLLAEAQTQGVGVPADLSVVGFDNVPYAELSTPSLTTVYQRTEEMGRLAVETILAAQRREPVSDINLRGDLIVRASTRPPITAH